MNSYFHGGQNLKQDQSEADRCALECRDDSRAIQSQRDEADINTIVKRFGVTGQLPQNVRAPTYGDFDTVMTYQDAQNAIIAANKSFMAMSADVRKRFDNDPAKFVEFCSDSKNLDEMRKLGLAKPEKVKENLKQPDEPVKNEVKKDG